MADSKTASQKDALQKLSEMIRELYPKTPGETEKEMRSKMMKLCTRLQKKEQKVAENKMRIIKLRKLTIEEARLDILLAQQEAELKQLLKIDD